MHTHVSALAAAYVFLMVVIMGTFWRLIAARLATSSGFAGQAGKAMAFQY